MRGWGEIFVVPPCHQSTYFQFDITTIVESPSCMDFREGAFSLPELSFFNTLKGSNTPWGLVSKASGLPIATT